MTKYWQIFKISFQQEFVYRLNFIMWRFRNVMQIFFTFFLWNAVFSDSQRFVFGYNRASILTYIFGLIVVRSIVLSIRSIDVAGEIARGDLTNILLKPISYFRYWLIRDISSKALNLIFATVEIAFLFLILRPEFFFQRNFIYIVFFILAIIIAIVLYFLLVFLFSMPTFWFPHQAWGFMFLLFIFSDLLGGGVFPIDILPGYLQKIIYFSPFPYLLYVPIGIYLGKFEFFLTLRFLIVSLFWVGFLTLLNERIWRKGLEIYRAEGR